MKILYISSYDYEEYQFKRGMYIDIKTELPNGICEKEDELLERIVNCNFEDLRANLPYKRGDYR